MSDAPRSACGAASEVLARCAELPGGRRAAGAGARAARTWRWSAAPCATCCSGRSPRELDVVVAGDAATFARRAGVASLAHADAGDAARALRHGGGASGTAGRIDVAERRAESYPAPGALPEVRPGSDRGGPRRAGTSRSTRSLSPLGGPARGALARGRARARGSGGGPPARAARARASSTTPRACCAWRATARAWASRSSRTRASWPRRRSRRARWRRCRGARVGAELRLALAEADAPRGARAR